MKFNKRSLYLKLSLVGIVMFLLYSCNSSKNIVYYQDVDAIAELNVPPAQEIVLMPGDKISVIVSCKDPKLTELFNLTYVSQKLGGASGNGQVSGYTIDSEGFIDVPAIGKVHVAGITRKEAEDKVKQTIIAQEQATEAVVTIEFMDLNIEILGEIARPGRYAIDKDVFTLIEALSAAGDLTIYGKRENVLVMRKENGVQKSYRVNLCSAQDVFNSPAFYLKQNDIIYVEPNDTRARQSTVNGNNVRSTSFWLSVASFLTSIVLVFIR
ncbi:MAG: polysaccharide biosynthesis/export family protein [Bacteroidales bacterium]|jgi:polysaccharide export outer membrane protein|nr:polysaccharide biosynthesis/export family protein [Bacteroidales bacterium]